MLVSQQLVPRAHRRFVARGVVRMAGLKRKDQPVEEAPTVARAAGEQPVHRRSQPQHAEPFAQRIDRGRRAIEAHLPPLGRAGLRPGADVGLAELGRDRPGVAAALARHVRQRRAAQAAARGQHRHGFEQVGLARAVLAIKQDKARPRQNCRRGVGAKVGQGQAADGHLARPSGYCSRRSMTS